MAMERNDAEAGHIIMLYLLAPFDLVMTAIDKLLGIDEDEMNE